MSAAPSVSVVVPVLNAARTLPYCLGSLERLDPAPSQVLLVDNGSTDGSLGLLRAFAERRSGARALEEPRRGAAAARNAGIRAATGDVVAFTDSDCEPESEWLDHLTRPFTDARVGAVAGRVTAAPAGSITELFSALYTLQSPNLPARLTHWTPWQGGFPTANLAVRRRRLEELGGFDERIEIYGEDYDLCARLYTAGAEVAYEPEAVVVHHHRTSVAGMLRQTFGFGRAHPFLLNRHAPRGLWIDLPFRSFGPTGFPGRAWVDLAAADKKVLAILLLGAVYGPSLWLLAPYAGWLVVLARRRARIAGAPVSLLGGMALAGMLLLKSGAMTAGRWYGSARYGAVCF